MFTSFMHGSVIAGWKRRDSIRVFLIFNEHHQYDWVGNRIGRTSMSEVSTVQTSKLDVYIECVFNCGRPVRTP